jgi:cyanophycinase
LEKLGAGAVDFIICSRETADDDTSLAKLEGVNGIFFSGGDQARLAAALVGTQFLEKIKEIYRRGGVISGTSAGAAVMSKLMITGNELKYPPDPESKNSEETYPFRTIEEKNIELKEGFGFIETAIIDQHFIRRKRHNRLISLVLEHPDLIGIGIDESTAIIVKPDQTFEVLGENTVLVYDPTDAKNVSLDRNGNLSASNIQMSILRSGQQFNLKTNKVIP